ncbi:MAG: nuclear transport factor 2 family protein [bacterium]
MLNGSSLPAKLHDEGGSGYHHEMCDGLCRWIPLSRFWDYLHVAKFDGQWKIVNVLWIPPPAAPKENLLQAESNAVINCTTDYAEGGYEGNADRMRKAVHPELNKVLPLKHRRTGKLMLVKTTASQLIEMAGAKLGILEKEKRNVQVSVLDVMENVASVKLTSARYDDYLHLVKIDGEWKIINALWRQPLPAK